MVRSVVNTEFVIETRGLTKSYGNTLAVKSLDLNVRRGEVYGFLGPNGAGKTTTLRMLLGLIKPSSGNASVLGKSPGESEMLRRAGALVESAAFYLPGQCSGHRIKIGLPAGSGESFFGLLRPKRYGRDHRPSPAWEELGRSGQCLFRIPAWNHGGGYAARY